MLWEEPEDLLHGIQLLPQAFMLEENPHALPPEDPLPVSALGEVLAGWYKPNISLLPISIQGKLTLCWEFKLVPLLYSRPPYLS